MSILLFLMKEKSMPNEVVILVLFCQMFILMLYGGKGLLLKVLY